MEREIVIFMPIKLNSKRVKNKNIRAVAGRPMFCWLAETADKMGFPFYIFTNYEEELRKRIDFIPKNLQFLNRSPALDTDAAQGIDIYKEFRSKIPAEVYLLLHCTSPFLRPETLQKTLQAVVEEGYNSSLTVEKKLAHIWYENKPLNFTSPRPRTQDLNPIYIETVGAFCYRAETITKGDRVDDDSVKFIEVFPAEAIDIDTEADLAFANLVGAGGCLYGW